MIDLGKVRPGSVLRIPFGSFAAATGAPAAVTNYADADIQVYKDGGTTQRASAAGLTATTTFDTLTGINLLTIDLADNTTADFWASGSEYIVVVSDITVDAQTLRFPIARFVIGIRGEVLATTIATLASQTSFTLTAGSADNSAYVGCVVYIHDAASAVQCCFGVVSAYTGSTKTVTLAADPAIFTMAAKDNISFMPPANAAYHGGTVQTARDIGASVLLSSGTGTGQVKLAAGYVAPTWADIAAPTTTVNLSGTTIATTQKVDVETIKTNPVVNAGTITFPTTATLASTTNITAGTIATATAVTTVNGLAAGVITAASIAADAITAAKVADGTIDAATFAAGAINAAAIAADAITDAKVASDVTIASVTGAVGSVTGNVGGNVTGTVGGFATAAKAEIEAEVNDALVVHRLDELLNADSDIDGAAPPTVGSVFHELMTKTAGSFTYDQTTDSVEAIRDRGDASWITATGFSAHSAADVWAVATRVLTAGTNIALAKGTGVTGFNDLDAAGVRSAVGLGAANIDTQFDALPTNSELAAALGTADDATLVQVALVKAKTDLIPASPAAVGSAMTLTSAYDFAKGTVAMTEAYAANSVAPTPVEAMFAIHQMLMQFGIASTAYTVKKLDNSTTAFVVTLNDATTPTAAVRV